MLDLIYFLIAWQRLARARPRRAKASTGGNLIVGIVGAILGGFLPPRRAGGRGLLGADRRDGRAIVLLFILQKIRK